MFESKDTDMWSSGKGNDSLQPSSDGRCSLGEARRILEGYYRTASRLTKLIPCVFLSFPLCIVLPLVAPTMMWLGVVIPFVCIGTCIRRAPVAPPRLRTPRPRP